VLFQILSFSSVLFALFACQLLADNSNTTPNQLKIDPSMQPTMGYPKAKVQVVALLEPKCPDSKRYNNQVYPKFEEEFINTNKVRYTVIPVSFLPHSMPAAIALLCVYNQDSQYPNSDLFFNYLNYLYKNQPPERENWATIETLQKFAAATSPAIQLDRLKDCIANEKYRIQIEKNTAYGNQLMKGHLSTPTIFVDGVQVENKDDTIDWEKLKAAIEQALHKRS
jgi:protein-disulfide isomerase